jgi:hypothetical protein
MVAACELGKLDRHDAEGAQAGDLRGVEVGEDAGGDGSGAARTGVTNDGADRDLTAVEAVGIEFPAEEEEIGGAHTVDGTEAGSSRKAMIIDGFDEPD